MKECLYVFSLPTPQTTDSMTDVNTELDISNLELLEGDQVANGIYNALKPTIQAIDSNIKNVLDSQAELSQRLEYLESGM